MWIGKQGPTHKQDEANHNKQNKPNEQTNKRKREGARLLLLLRARFGLSLPSRRLSMAELDPEAAKARRRS